MKDLDIPLLILCGGKGSRLATLVKDTPKPLLKFDGKPFLEKILDKWFRLGQRNFVFAAGYKGKKIEQFVINWANKNKGAFVRTVIEQKPLGTGGAIKNILNFFNFSGRILVTNADTICPVPRARLLNSTLNSLTTVKVKNAKRFGSLLINGTEIISFLEKDQKKERIPCLINSGIYSLDCGRIREYGKEKFSLETDFLPKLVKEKNLRAIFTRGEFIDIGTVEDFYKLKNKKQ